MHFPARIVRSIQLICGLNSIVKVQKDREDLSGGELSLRDVPLPLYYSIVRVVIVMDSQVIPLLVPKNVATVAPPQRPEDHGELVDIPDKTFVNNVFPRLEDINDLWRRVPRHHFEKPDGNQFDLL